jgi:trk system potassium uptake protein TrkA
MSHSGHDVWVVDRDPAVSERAKQRYGLVTITGDATDASVLDDAELNRADVVVAMLSRDADNLAVALLARAAGVRRVMVRMRDSAYRPVYESAGVDRLLSEMDVIIGALATAIEHAAVQHAMLLGDGDSVAFELAIPETSENAGRTVGEIAASPGFPPSCVFAGLYLPDGVIEGPRGNSVVRGGMTVLLVARHDELTPTIDFMMRGR